MAMDWAEGQPQDCQRSFPIQGVDTEVARPLCLTYLYKVMSFQPLKMWFTHLAWRQDLLKEKRLEVGVF